MLNSEKILKQGKLYDIINKSILHSAIKRRYKFMSVLKSYKHTFFACYAGYFVQSIINNFLPLLFLTIQNSFSLSYDKISLLIVVNFGVQLFVDLISTAFVDRLGYGKCVIAAHVFASLGLFGLGVLPFVLNPYTGILLSITVYAIGSGLIEVIISPIVEACPGERKSAQMSLLHSFYCWGQMAVVLLSTLFFVLFGRESWRYLAYIRALVPFFNGIYFTLVPIPPVLAKGESLGMKGLLKSRLFYAFALLMLCSGASEIAMSQWASAFAESGLRVSKTVGDLLGPCLFAALMGGARVGYAKLSHKISLTKAMALSGTLCLICYLVTALSPVAWLSLLGCALCGLSVGIMWPATFSLAAEKIPKGGTVMFALLALFGDLGCTTGPGLVGAVTSRSGGELSNGILLAVIFPSLLLVALRLTGKEKNIDKV